MFIVANVQTKLHNSCMSCFLDFFRNFLRYRSIFLRYWMLPYHNQNLVFTFMWHVRVSSTLYQKRLLNIKCLLMRILLICNVHKYRIYEINRRLTSYIAQSAKMRKNPTCRVPFLVLYIPGYCFMRCALRNSKLKITESNLIFWQYMFCYSNVRSL